MAGKTEAPGRGDSARDLATATGLSFAAGYVDTAAFIALYGLFTAHVTGNFVLIGAELVTTSTGVLAKLLALPVFLLAVALSRVIALGFEARGRGSLRWLLGLEGLLLAGFGIIGTLRAPFASADAPDAILVGMLGVAAMGIQNALARLSLAHLAQTTVMTGNVTQAVIDAVDLARGAVPPGSPARGRMRRMLPAVVAFAIGAIAGAFGVAGLGFACAAIPVAVLVALAALAR
ncbi:MULTISPECIES: YoaK family protein [Methylobacterium]|uniref:DUF1275 domain-containing protein n=3 Tax=Pseudomonadota TaxID=1224 RepID=A0ABQ4SQW2_9HYPH|nr:MULTISPECIES: YoaK family protein [Methylobacterium]PIU05049.1 MAG: DUF1275 domain-containing protein [Methylobacterium sp. CG09_land_8_20_14_0_10_71_15]PIU11551.1 MAG: DUF1275 domain-containing protein [Methylobacterium sp. CG08_land_8_20_14_0_20_71_15]GBU16622.1 hypothetical protein AwMethylo_08370 [Methylobacterium sp.]GJE05582.1 hypothetical protein AOPFMNJM_0885 [Methylobacterium jeotgali]